MRLSSRLFSAMALFVSLGIGVDNAVNTFYFLKLEHWSLLWCWATTLSSMLLNGLLYHTGAKATLTQTKNKILAIWYRIKQAHHRGQSRDAVSWHAECVALGSAITMYGFTLFHYQSCPSWMPMFLSTTFSLCYFVGTYTLILQACTRPVRMKWVALHPRHKCIAALLWSIMALATVAAGCQWWAGLIGWLPGPHMHLLAIACCACLMVGESSFIAHIAIDLAQHLDTSMHQTMRCAKRTWKVKAPYKTIGCWILVMLNAAGFAGMTQFDSWLSHILMGQSAWLLGFALSLLIMLHTALYWQKAIDEHH